MSDTASKKNWIFIIGILMMSVGMQFANYGTTVPISGHVAEMNATQYYVLISTMASLGMMLILPIVGKLMSIFGTRNVITLGIIIQLTGRMIMMFCSSWIPFAAAYFFQALGTGLYTTAPFVLMAFATDAKDRVKFLGYIAMANALGAILGPMIASVLYSLGGFMGRSAYISNLPLTILGYILLVRYCPNQKMPEAAKGFDYLGVVLTVTGLAGMVFWLNLGGKMIDWISVPSFILVAIAVVCLFWMFKREMTIQAPAVPIKMFRNKRLTYAVICNLVYAVFCACALTYPIMWVRMNYSHLPLSTLYSGTYNIAQQLVTLVLGFFLGSYIGKKFAIRFRKYGIAAMAVALLGMIILYCLKFTGTAEGGDLVFVGGIPAGMLIIYLGSSLGGFTGVVAQSCFTGFWQLSTPQGEIPSGQSLYNFSSQFGSVLGNTIITVVLGTSLDYTRAFLVGMAACAIGLIAAVKGFRFTPEEIAAAK